MGGYGSGRWKNHQKSLRVDQCAVYSIADARSRWLSSDGNVPPNIELMYQPMYGQLQRQSVDLTSSPRRLGGAEQYFLCPGCQRRCKKLYRPNKEPAYRCRLCLSLTYRSCQESHRWDKAATIPVLTDLLHLEKVHQAHLRLYHATSKRAINRAAQALQRLTSVERKKLST